MQQKTFRALIPVFSLFVLISLVAVVFPRFLQTLNIDQTLIITGNAILFIVTILSFQLYRRALIAGTTYGFLGNVYGGLFLKFLICLISVFIYVFSMRTALNKAGLFILMFFYLVYTFLEVGILMKQRKQQNNA